MATTTGKSQCVICQKERSAVRCEGCFQIFCYNHLNDHRQEFSKIFAEIETNRDVFRQTLNEQKTDPKNHNLIKQIDQWESNSIAIIQQTAQECRERILEQTDEHFKQIEINLTKLTNEIREVRQENDFNENDLNQLKEKLTQLGKELDQISNISIQEDSRSFIKKISIVASPSNHFLIEKIIYINFFSILIANVIVTKKILFKIIILGM
jgi:NTP pyrophosphatase (non-canonical NTP hydrolase)